jgi:hypothetical protein
MATRRLLILEAYLDPSGKEHYRVSNPPGLDFFEDMEKYTLWDPPHCKAAVINEMTKVMNILCKSGQW